MIEIARDSCGCYFKPTFIVLQRNRSPERRMDYECFVSDGIHEMSLGGFNTRLDFAIDMTVHMAKRWRVGQIIPIGFDDIGPKVL